MQTGRGLFCNKQEKKQKRAKEIKQKEKNNQTNNNTLSIINSEEQENVHYGFCAKFRSFWTLWRFFSKLGAAKKTQGMLSWASS